ncbi:hypothetical protein M8C21_033425 [Ambrosia artemisiifolia]|uniref:non-specific serine/threonine protein kinase n=1 Tax=Ambrosia artemisiifolia TaxID=4212 RepID=A0AAD5C0B5_AMBAR|nr:hypothetical protein M8C21_033425 [Ambrosia artemisiifolia]
MFLTLDTEQSQETHKIIQIEDEEEDDDDDHKQHDESSPRGVFEILLSGSDSDNHSTVSRSLSSRGSSFNEKSPELEPDGDCATECGGNGLISSSSMAQDIRWRHLVCNLKWKSFKRFSTVPLVAGYEMSRKSLMRRLGRHNVGKEMVDGVRWMVRKPSWRNFTLDELSVATGGFCATWRRLSAGKGLKATWRRLSAGKGLRHFPSISSLYLSSLCCAERSPPKGFLPLSTCDSIILEGSLETIETLENLVGRGGHAEVYKGCLPDGQLVAVKKITKKEKKDEDRVEDFLSELGIIAHINHPNAAHLIGFSSDTDLHLVLQFAPHGSLATLLHNNEERLDWALRFKIAIGIAEGLLYLHSQCQRRIIHRDITASNILLMEDYQPQISDFGLAKWLPDKWLHHIVSPIEGTFGYMAPEYFMHGIVHEKIDVFSFGVLLLELITGRRAVDSSRQSLVIWAKPFLEQSNVKELVDPRLEGKYEMIEVKRAMSAASACIHHLPSVRPNMKRVMQMLKGERSEPKPKIGGGRALLIDACDLDDYSSTTYLKDLNRHRELVMG